MRDKFLCIQNIVFHLLSLLQQTCSEKFDSQSVTMPTSTRLLSFLYFLVVFGKGIYHRLIRVSLGLGLLLGLVLGLVPSRNLVL